MTRLVTRLEPMTPERSKTVGTMIRLVQDNTELGIATNEDGILTAIVNVDDPDISLILGDFDVHA